MFSAQNLRYLSNCWKYLLSSAGWSFSAWQKETADTRKISGKSKLVHEWMSPINKKEQLHYHEIDRWSFMFQKIWFKRLTWKITTIECLPIPPQSFGNENEICVFFNWCRLAMKKKLKTFNAHQTSNPCTVDYLAVVTFLAHGKIKTHFKIATKMFFPQTCIAVCEWKIANLIRTVSANKIFQWFTTCSKRCISLGVRSVMRHKPVHSNRAIFERFFLQFHEVHLRNDWTFQLI